MGPGLRLGGTMTTKKPEGTTFVIDIEVGPNLRALAKCISQIVDGAEPRKFLNLVGEIREDYPEALGDRSVDTTGTRTGGEG